MRSKLSAPVVVQIQTCKGVSLIMDGVFSLGFRQHVVNSRIRKRSVGRIANGEWIDLPAQRREAFERVLCSVYDFRQNDIRGPVSREITSVDAERSVFRCCVRVVQTKITRDNVRTTVGVEVADRKAIPPTARRAQSRCHGLVAKTLPIVSEKIDWHPFTDGDQIQLSVSVEIQPGSIGHHPTCLNELRRDLRSDAW